ncbi:MAG: hypothetical protein GC200_11865 [Tepidisphaera sp.]|nr:hypothetical protein [Tepidisphaera sp.]
MDAAAEIARIDWHDSFVECVTVMSRTKGVGDFVEGWEANPDVYVTFVVYNFDADRSPRRVIVRLNGCGQLHLEFNRDLSPKIEKAPSGQWLFYWSDGDRTSGSTAESIEILS